MSVAAIIWLREKIKMGRFQIGILWLAGISAVAANAEEPVASGTSTDPAVTTLVNDARKLMRDCVIEVETQPCDAAANKFRATIAHAKADNVLRHSLFAEYMRVVTVQGRIKREAGQYDEALAVLRPAYAEVIKHLDGGKHFHTLIDNMPLQQELYLNLAARKQDSEAATVLLNAREIARRLDLGINRASADPRLLNIVDRAYIGSEHLETSVAKFHRASATKARKDGDLARAQQEAAKSIDASRRAIHWIQKRDTAKVVQKLDVEPHFRRGERNMAIGDILLEQGDRKAAEIAYRDAAKANCTLENDMGPRCQTALWGVMKANGEADRMTGAMSQEMYRKQMEIMNTDISNVTKRVQSK